MSVKKAVTSALASLLVLTSAACSNPQGNPAKTAQEVVQLMVDGEFDKACDHFASDDGPLLRDSEFHAACVYIFTKDNSDLAAYKGKKLTVSSASVDGDTAEVGPDDVNEEFRPLFEQSSIELIKIDDKWYVDAGDFS